MAALIDALDIVISIDTGAAHLAAALGAKTWVLLREAGDWRYGVRGDTVRGRPRCGCSGKIAPGAGAGACWRQRGVGRTAVGAISSHTTTLAA